MTFNKEIPSATTAGSDNHDAATKAITNGAVNKTGGRNATAAATKRLKIQRHFTTGDASPYDQVEWKNFTSRLTNEAGEVLHEVEVEAPAFYSQSAVDIISSKYFRKAGVPQYDAEGLPVLDEEGNHALGGETSMRQVVHRLAGCWADWGKRYGYFDDEDAKVFYDEVAWMLLHQYFAPNSPQWFNTGLFYAYGIDNTSQKRFFFNPETGEVEETTSRYQRPEPMACYIGRLEDSLTDPNGIYDFLSREGRIFQAGAGSGANFSALRGAGEKLSGGGESSGMMSFLKLFDRSAGAIKSGGTTRRAAKMVVVDVDHPEVEEFIWWKANEEKKVAALVAAGYDSDWRGEAYQTVSGQNSNNSISVSHEFMEALKADEDWHLTARTTGEPMRTVKARDLWRQIAEASWQSADPGLQFNGIMNDWHTVPHVGPIRASNPCSEYLSLDDSACNLASLKLTSFLRQSDSGVPVFDVDGFTHAVKLVTLVLEISVAMAQLPDEIVAGNTYKLRNLGLGYADLGALLMRTGLAYDSEAGRAVAASITSLLSAAAYEQSAVMAEAKGAYEYYHAANHLRVIRNHRAAHTGGGFEGLRVNPQVLQRNALPDWAEPIFEAGTHTWDKALEKGEAHGYRNSQVAVIAPTGTISFCMDCDTTGIEPDFALVKFKKLAGGGTMQIVNQAVDPALAALGYGEAARAEIISHIAEHGTAAGAPGLDPEHLPIFDTAVGERSISAEGHVLMLGATAPFLSGAASKTINMPSEATVEDLEQIHQMAYDLGVKCIAVYRDGSKMSQVLSATNTETKAAFESQESTIEKIRKLLVSPPAGVSPKTFYAQFGLTGAPRFTLASARAGRTWEFKVGGTKVFLRAGEYEDGSLGEIFIDLAKEGATLRGVISCFAMAVSHGLQTGIPLRKLVDQFTFQTFEPRGMVERHDHVKMASSIVDAVFRILAVHYLRDDSLAQVKFDAGQARLLEVEEEKAVIVKSNGDRVVGDFTPDKTGRVKSEQPEAVSTGEFCTACGGTLVRTGTCHTCQLCGSTDGGCS